MSYMYIRNCVCIVCLKVLASYAFTSIYKYGKSIVSLLISNIFVLFIRKNYIIYSFVL